MNQYRVVLSLLSQKDAQLHDVTDIDLDFINLIGQISPGSGLVGDVFYPKILLQNMSIEYDFKIPDFVLYKRIAGHSSVFEDKNRFDRGNKPL
ncbi:hypothetical protein THOM_2601 [Trachipleistophora hominis]|uniref:Uncharacterized protein n=1 Tax=Trachipleistophora hominis TaxID=72359 RepID=L7JTX6_TRAHO|nr:hypothetical protein THOM_2601 [Trachipleistophora hominis]